MWWGIGFGVFFYLLLACTLGWMTLAKGHWVMFICGIFFPLFWVVGALSSPVEAEPA